MLKAEPTPHSPAKVAHRSLSRIFSASHSVEGMRKILGLVAVGVLLAGCSSATLPQPAPEPEAVEEAASAPEPEVVEEQPEPDDYTSSERLAAFDDRWSDRDLYEERFRQVVARCADTDEDTLANELYETAELLGNRGGTEDSLWAMEALLDVMADSDAGIFTCPEVLALFFVEIE
jgi:hypothetical protein